MDRVAVAAIVLRDLKKLTIATSTVRAKATIDVAPKAAHARVRNRVRKRVRKRAASLAANGSVKQSFPTRPPVASKCRDQAMTVASPRIHGLPNLAAVTERLANREVKLRRLDQIARRARAKV